MALPSILGAIGNTPLVTLSRLSRHVKGSIVAKVEFMNPGLSKKDRIALQMIKDAEEYGVLRPGQPVIELTSGNTGTGLAIVCALTGHKFYAVMSKGNSTERARMMSALGAEVILVDQAPGSVHGQVSGVDLERVRLRTEELTKSLGAFRADQFALLSNMRAHLLHTGPEIWKQTNGRIDAFVDFCGSAGTFAGCAAYFKSRNPNIKCYVVEPATAAVLGKSTRGKADTESQIYGNHRIQGGGYSLAPEELPQLNVNHVDGYLQVTDEEAIQTSRALARMEGIFAGFSSGANVAAALQLLQGSHEGQVVACMLCDSGLKYLSTDLFE
eukprot:m.239635 g.239635  ORF g.239635 m.239635 type:complete len:327 (-) comp22731_c0_seq1:69-1049(-)